MKISIIIPIHNVEKYLTKCIQSVINQSYSNLEIILVDDGSTDSSGYICDFFGNQDRRIKVIHQKNRGVSAARNSGLKVATGDAILFIDSDDYLNDRNLFEKAISIMKRDNIDIVSWLWYRELKNGTVKELEDHDKIVFGKRSSRDCVDMMFSDETSVVLFSHVWNKLFRRNVIINEEFKIGFGEDADLMMRVFHCDYQVYFMDSYSYTYVIRPGSLMHQRFSNEYFAYLEDVNAWIGLYSDRVYSPMKKDLKTPEEL